MTCTKAINRYNLWYGLRDERLVNDFIKYRNDDPEAFMSLIIFAGGAGTGKTRVLSKLSTQKGYRFICPTNISGQVMSSTIDSNNLYGCKTFGTNNTIHKFYGEDVQATEKYESIIRDSVDVKTAYGNFDSLKQLYDAYDVSFNSICSLKFQNSMERHNYISKKSTMNYVISVAKLVGPMTSNPKMKPSLIIFWLLININQIKFRINLGIIHIL